MQHLVLASLLAGLTAGCITNLQHHAAFRASVVEPAEITAAVGDVVAFHVMPTVDGNTAWGLDTHGRVRFAGESPRSHRDWVPREGQLAFEAIVSPWDPKDGYQREAARGWLWFELRDSGASQSFDQTLPISRLPFREVGPVTVTTAFTLEKREANRLQVVEAPDRVTVRYLTPIDQGFPYAPRVLAMLLETGGKKRLYAEVRTNYGDRPKEPIGYEVTLSYPTSVQGPVEVILVEWRGHGWYYGPFEVYRTNAGVGAGAAGTPAVTGEDPGAATDPAGTPRTPPALTPVVPAQPETPPPAPPKVESVIPGNPKAAPSP